MKNNIKLHLIKFIFVYLLIILLILGNIISWYTNGKLLKPITYVLFTFLIFTSITNAIRKSRKY